LLLQVQTSFVLSQDYTAIRGTLLVSAHQSGNRRLVLAARLRRLANAGFESAGTLYHINILDGRLDPIEMGSALGLVSLLGALSDILP